MYGIHLRMAIQVRTYGVLKMQLHRYNFLELTTESTLPGFWMRSAFTTWNTSTMPSVFQHSVALIREQNTPHRLTVSLHEMCVFVCALWKCMCVCVCVEGKQRNKNN